MKGQAPQGNHLNDVEAIYQRYLQAYKKGVFNFIKEDTDRLTNETIPRKYFSGGVIDYAQAAQYLGHVDPFVETQVLPQTYAGHMTKEIRNEDFAQVIMGEINAAMKGRPEVGGRKNVQSPLVKDITIGDSKAMANLSDYAMDVSIKDMEKVQEKLEGYQVLGRRNNLTYQFVWYGKDRTGPMIGTRMSRVPLTYYLFDYRGLDRVGIMLGNGPTATEIGYFHFFVGNEESKKHLVIEDAYLKEAHRSQMIIENFISKALSVVQDVRVLSFSNITNRPTLIFIIEHILLDQDYTTELDNSGQQATLILIRELIPKWKKDPRAIGDKGKEVLEFIESYANNQKRLENLKRWVSGFTGRFARSLGFEQFKVYFIDGTLNFDAEKDAAMRGEDGAMAAIPELIGNFVIPRYRLRAGINFKKAKDELYAILTFADQEKSVDKNGIPLDVKNYVSDLEDPKLKMRDLLHLAYEILEKTRWSSVRDIFYEPEFQLQINKDRRLIFPRIDAAMKGKQGGQNDAEVSDMLKKMLSGVKNARHLPKPWKDASGKYPYTVTFNYPPSIKVNRTLRMEVSKILGEKLGGTVISSIDTRYNTIRLGTHLSLEEFKERFDLAMTPGGIDMNSANLNLRIKRDGKGVPLPLAQQDLAQLSNIQGLDPIILSIKPASQTALFSQLVEQS